MKKSLLVQMLVLYAQDKEKHHIGYVNVERSNYLTLEEDMDCWACHVSGAANTKIAKGKIVFGQEYLYSRGEELGFGLKPSVVLEYSGHWPFDFCYLYKL